MRILFAIWARAFLSRLQRQPLAIQHRYFEATLRQGDLSKRAAFQVAMQIRLLSALPHQSRRASTGAGSKDANCG